MAVTGYCYYIDSNMVEDTPSSIKVHRVGLLDDGGITLPQTQTVQINTNVSYGERMLGATVQPTPSCLILIGGETDSGSNSPPIAYALRNSTTGEITSSFRRVEHSITGSLAQCFHFYHVAQDSTQSVYIVGSNPFKGQPDFNIYRILLDSSGLPKSIVYCGRLPGSGTKHKSGVLAFIQDGKLWVFLREANGITPYWINVGADGAIPSQSIWTKAKGFSSKNYNFSLRNGKSYAFSQNGGRFFIEVTGPWSEYCLVAEMIGGNLDAWSEGYCSGFRDTTRANGILISNGNKFYALREYKGHWWWFSCNAPSFGPYVNLPLYLDHYTGLKYLSREVDGRAFHTFYTGGVTYPTPPNTRPSVKPVLTNNSINGLISNRIYGEGSVSGADLVVAKIDDGTYSQNKLQLSGGQWTYSNGDLEPGGHTVYVRAYNQYSNFVETSFGAWLAKRPPVIDFRLTPYKGQSYYVTVTDNYAGIRYIDYAVLNSFPSNFTYTRIVEKERQVNGVFKAGRFSLMSATGTAQFYLLVRAFNSIGLKSEVVFPVNTVSQQTLSPPFIYSAVNGVCKQRVRVEEDGSETIFVDIWWQYPPPEGAQYAQYEKGFTRYDFNKDSQFTGGVEYGYVAFLYGRWECLVKQNENDVTASFVPVTDWFPYALNPIVALDDEGNFVGTSVLTVALKPGFNILGKPKVSYPIGLIVNKGMTELPHYMQDMLVSPSVWRLNLVAYCNADWQYNSPIVCYEDI